jgi:hypothetical protein
MLWLMEQAGLKSSNVKHRQFWQQHNKPIELWSPAVIDQKTKHPQQPGSGWLCVGAGALEV